MPEDLRIKESEVLAKKQDNFQIDLIVPGDQAKTKSLQSGQSWWQKMLESFKRPPHFIEPIKTPHDKKPDKPDMHKKDFDIKFDKPKEFKAPKVEEVYHKAIKETPPVAKVVSLSDDNNQFFVKGLSEERKEERKNDQPDEMTNNPAQKEVVDIFNEPLKDIITAPASVEPIPTKPVELVTPPPAVTTPAPEHLKKNDFFIPKSVVEQPPAKELAPKVVKPVKESKFHQPIAGLGNRFINNGGGVDLIPMAVKTRSWRQITMLLILGVVGSALVVGIFYGALFVQGRNIANQEAAKASQISDLEKQILDYEELNKSIQNLGSNIILVHDVLNKHIYWTNFFALLEKYTIKGVYYRGLTAGNNGALTLQAVGKDYYSVAKQLKVLDQESAKEFVTGASVTGAKEASNGVEFDITLVLNPNLFYYDSQPIGNATSSVTN